MADPGLAVRVAASPALSRRDRAAMRELFAAAWPDGGFTEDDFAHAFGGTHWLAELGGLLVGHASVVPRVLEADGSPLRTGYVEAVATMPTHERRGIGSRLVAAASDHVRRGFELGALSTDRPAFYERLGWVRWRGPTFVREPAGLIRTPEEDNGILVLRTRSTPPLTLTGPLSCDWRRGDAW